MVKGEVYDDHLSQLMLRLSFYFHYIVLFYRFDFRPPRSIAGTVGEIADLCGTTEGLYDLPQLDKNKFHIAQLAQAYNLTNNL